MKGEIKMGAWDYGVFDDDVAYDALEELKESSNIAADMEGYFDTVIEAEYVDYDEGQYALVAAAVIDSVVNGTDYKCDEADYAEWTKSLKSIDFAPLMQKAANAVEAVVSEHSELKELWDENESLYTLWREDKIAMQKRLQ